MNEEKAPALRLADLLDERGPDAEEVAAELRRLHEVEKQRDELLEALRQHVQLHDGDCTCQDCAAIAKAEGA